MKLPNGFGTVYKMQGNRRRPYVVKKTIQGKQKNLGYFDTFEHGMSFLLQYNNAPPLLDVATTFQEIFRHWQETKFPKLSASSRKAYLNSYRHCQPLHAVAFASLRYGHLQAVIDAIRAKEIGYSTQKKVRGLLEQLYSYALKYDIVRTDYARYVEIDAHIRKYPKKPFTVRQRNKLWRTVGTLDGIEDVLILIYTGLRISEYLRLQAGDVKLRSHYFVVRQSKTAAGAGRPVPIHKVLYPWFVDRSHSRQYICQRPDGRPHTYESFRRVFDKVMAHFRMHHTPHEARHTTASMLDSAGANDTATKKILGHACKGVTKHDYTHKTIRELRKAIDAI